MGTSSSIVGKLYMNYNDYNLYLKEVSTFENLAILYFVTKRKVYLNENITNIDFHVNSESDKLVRYNKNERVDLKFTINLDSNILRNSKKEVKDYSFHGKDPHMIYEGNNWIQVNRQSNTVDCVIYIIKHRV